MGGQPALGYRQGHKLVVNEARAETVRNIFRHYTSVGLDRPVAAGGGPLPAIVRRDTSDRVPLFVDEITKARLVAPKWGALGPGIARH
jgi:hypothetical protein